MASSPRLLGFQFGYANAFYRLLTSRLGPASRQRGRHSQSHGATVHLDSRWQFTPETVGVLGYQFADIDYTGDQPIMDPAFLNVPSEHPQQPGHYGYAGIDQTFRPDLTGSLRVGARYTDYYNDPAVSGSVSPYVR